MSNQKHATAPQTHVIGDKERFIAELYPAATKVSQQTGMSRELILAQAALETGWGEKVLPGTHNIFNIKASPDWHGPTKTFSVPEFEHGKKVMVNAEFRVYASNEEALNDRVKFMQENPRYAKSGLFDEGIKGNLEKEASALQKAGYATDPKYAAQLAAVYHGPTMQRAIQSLAPITDKHHPGHALYTQALEGLEKCNAAHGIPSDQRTRNAAAVVAVEAHSHGLKRIDHVEPNIGGDKLIAVQGKPGTAHSKVIDVPTVNALSTPVEDSSKTYLQQVHQVTLQQGQQAHHAQDKPQPAMVRH